MKAIRIRLRWLNIGAVITTLLFLWMESEKAEQDKKIKSTNNSKFDDIVKHYQERNNA